MCPQLCTTDAWQPVLSVRDRHSCNSLNPALGSRYLTSKVDPVTGLWCTDAQKKAKGVIDCIGGSFHIDFVFAYAQAHPEVRTPIVRSGWPPQWSSSVDSPQCPVCVWCQNRSLWALLQTHGTHFRQRR